MKITPVRHTIDLAPGDPSRSQGRHASDIYTSYYQTVDPKRYPKDSPPDPVRMALGLAWEQYLERLLLKQGVNAERPGELQSPHGFSYSPDLFLFNGAFRVGEIKVTWMSSREWPRVRTNALSPQFDKWLAQVMLYAHEVETPHATLYPYFVNGNYRHGGPEFLPLNLEFSVADLRDNFSKLRQHARNEGLL